MKVAYVFITPRGGTYKLGQMILPQLEAGVHGAEVVGMFFFDDNCFVLRQGDPIGERLAKIAEAQNILLMMCDMCALERNLAEGEPKWCDSKGHGAHRHVGVHGEALRLPLDWGSAGLCGLRRRRAALGSGAAAPLLGGAL